MGNKVYCFSHILVLLCLVLTSLLCRFPLHRIVIICVSASQTPFLPALPILPGYEVTTEGLEQRMGCSRLNLNAYSMLYPHPFSFSVYVGQKHTRESQPLQTVLFLVKLETNLLLHCINTRKLCTTQYSPRSLVCIFCFICLAR